MLVLKPLSLQELSVSVSSTPIPQGPAFSLLHSHPLALLDHSSRPLQSLGAAASGVPYSSWTPSL